MAPLSRGSLVKFLQTGLDGPESINALCWVERELRVVPTTHNTRVIRAIAAIKMGAYPEDVASVLDWKEFETFCAALFRAKGFEVSENITTARPRMQVDLLARSGSLALVVDCKHWYRPMAMSSLSRVIASQEKRADLFRMKRPSLEPMVVVILSAVDETVRYMDGAAIVPVFTLANFLDNLVGYAEGLPRH
jgi:hypothetical protein